MTLHGTSETPPSPQSDRRRLAAIMVADIAGFSALMEKDESGTFNRVRELRDQLIAPRIAEHGGRIIKTTGDGFLAEFSSATSALRCGVEIQRANHAREASLPEADRLRLRIGLNVGDIIADGDDVAGDGVIIAARLEPLAPPNGICVSGTVREHVRQDLGLEFFDLGDQQIKNISRPIRAYRIDPTSTETSRSRAEGSTLGSQLSREGALSRDLSFVVLPLANRTGDPEQDYFADGLTESITMDLSRIHGAFIVSASTAFSYKNKAPTASQVGKELGVRFIVSGSLQRYGTRVRLNVQLADATSNEQLWSETAEGDQSDLFTLQDQLTARIANSVGRKVIAITSREAERKCNPKAADLMLRLRAITLKAALSIEDLRQIELLSREILALEPSSSAAMGYLATAIMFQTHDSLFDADPSTKEMRLSEGRDIALRLRALDPNEPNVYVALGYYAMTHDDYDGWRRAAEKVVSLNPKSPNVYNNLASVLIGSGEPKKAIEALDQATNLDPKRESAALFTKYCWAYFMLGNDEAATSWARRLLDVDPACSDAHAVLAMIYALAGDVANAHLAAGEVRRIRPLLLLKSFEPSPSRPAAYKRYFQERLTPAWRKAGLPE